MNVKKMLKNTAGLGGIVVSLYVGDKLQPITSIQENTKFYNISAEDGTPYNFRNYHTKIEINEKGRAELYFGADNTYQKVNEDGSVGCNEYSNNNTLESYKQEFNKIGNKANEKISETYETLKEKVKQIFDKGE